MRRILWFDALIDAHGGKRVCEEGQSTPCATMPSRNIIPKQGNAKALRAKRKREPQVHENAKTAIIIKGRKTSQDVTDALKDIVSAS